MNPKDTKRYEHVRRFLGQVSLRATLLYLAVGISLLLAVLALGRGFSHHMATIESGIEGLGPWGPIVFVAMFVLVTSCLLPQTALFILAGTLFDFTWALVASTAGMLLSASLQFILARRLMRSRIQSMITERPQLSAIQHAVAHNEFRLQVLLRLTPLSPAILNYLLGAVGVRFSGFLIACLLKIPGLVIDVYFGHAGKNLAKLAGASDRTSHTHSVLIMGGIVLGLGAIFLVSYFARKGVLQALARAEEI